MTIEQTITKALKQSVGDFLTIDRIKDTTLRPYMIEDAIINGDVYIDDLAIIFTQEIANAVRRHQRE